MSNARQYCRNLKIIGTTIFVFLTVLFLGHYLYRYTARKNSERSGQLIRKENFEKDLLTLFNSIKEQFVADVISKIEEELIHTRDMRYKDKFDSKEIMPSNLNLPEPYRLSTGDNVTTDLNISSRSILPCICPSITGMNLKLGVLKGKRGLYGVKGEKGEKGSLGLPGASGIKGKKGKQGYRGIIGADGYTGEIGEPGPAGAFGQKEAEDGIPGLHGYPGDPGYNGLRGLPGLPGKRGPQGPPGPEGARGDTGFPAH